MNELPGKSNERVAEPDNGKLKFERNCETEFFDTVTLRGTLVCKQTDQDGELIAVIDGQEILFNDDYAVRTLSKLDGRKIEVRYYPIKTTYIKGPNTGRVHIENFIHEPKLIN